MKRLALVGALALPMLVAACSDTPVAPQVKPQFATDAALAKVAKYKTGGPSSQARFASKTIDGSGGTLSLGGFSVLVPPGAVSTPTTFTISLPDGPRAGYALADFGPHGAQFAVPVVLTLPFKGTSAEGDVTTHVLWNSGIDWIVMPSWVTTDGRLQTVTNHFSEYGTEETGRGITTAGG